MQLLALGLLLFLHLWHNSTLSVDNYQWILQPLTALVSSFSGQSFQYQTGVGWLNQSQSILINQSCAGLNFMLIAYGLLLLLVLPSIKRVAIYGIACLIAVPITYCWGLLANCSRILSAMLLQKTAYTNQIGSENLLHLGVGIAVYLLFLIFYYFLWTYFINMSQENH